MNYKEQFQKETGESWYYYTLGGKKSREVYSEYLEQKLNIAHNYIKHRGHHAGCNVNVFTNGVCNCGYNEALKKIKGEA